MNEKKQKRFRKPQFKKKKKKKQKGLHRNYHCFHTPSHRTYIFLKMTNIEFVRFIAS